MSLIELYQDWLKESSGYPDEKVQACELGLQEFLEWLGDQSEEIEEGNDDAYNATVALSFLRIGTVRTIYLKEGDL